MTDTKEFSREFEFGKIDYNQTGIKTHLVTLEVSLKIKDKKPVFSASGNVWNTRHTDIVMGGQCIDDIYKEYHLDMTRDNANIYRKIMELWQRNHLNDMNAGCIHQRKNWDTDKDLKLAKLKLDLDKAGKQVRDIEKRVDEEVKKKLKASITKYEQKLLNLPYWVTVPIEEVKKYTEFYSVEEEKTEKAHWVNPEDHPEGLLGKPCEVCGYKYGTAWNYEPISQKDMREICNLLNIPHPMRSILLRWSK